MAETIDFSTVPGARGLGIRSLSRWAVRSRATHSVISRARVLKRPSYYRFVRGGSVTIEQLGLLELCRVLYAIGKPYRGLTSTAASAYECRYQQH